MTAEKKMRRTLIAICTLILMLSMTVCSYAEAYYECRDDKISIDLPDDWEMTEIYDEDASEDGYCEHIFTAGQMGKQPALRLDAYYAYSDAAEGEYIYFYDDPESAEAYYDAYGEAALRQTYEYLINMKDSSAQITYGDTEFISGQWNGFIRLNVDISADLDGDGKSEARRDTVYLTAQMTDGERYIVQNMLIFNNGTPDGPTAADFEIIEAVVDSFYDYGYGAYKKDDLVDYDYQYYGDNAGVDIGAVIGTVVWVIIIAAGVIALIAFRKKRKNKASPAAWVPAGGGQRAGEKATGRFSAKAAPKTSAAASTDAEARYIRSLKTLYKSGLLTRDEMNEMIAKHQNRYWEKGGRR